MAKPLYDEIVKYIATNPARFHMPAHFGVGDDDTMLYSSARFDVTELPFSDNLQNPTGVIAASEKECAAGYGAKRSYYFTSGATTAIFTAIAAARAYGNDIIIQRASHKSVYSAIRFFVLTPNYINPTFSSDGLANPQTPEAIINALNDNPSARAVVITSPDYFGRCADAEKITAACKSRGVLLIADESHGAHFPYSELLPKGFSGVADMEIVSLHKTLAVYTGGAVLNVNNEELFDKITALRADIHTTSPNYTILASMDYALDEIRRNGKSEYARLYEAVEKLKKSVKLPFLAGDDFSRVTVKTGKDLSALYAAGVIPEATYGDYSVFICSPYNIDKLDRLSAALNEVIYSPAEKLITSLPTPVKGALCGREAFLPLADAIGKTAAREAGVYPPGIPVVARGEVITAEIAEILSSAPNFGFVNNRICVIL